MRKRSVGVGLVMLSAVMSPVIGWAAETCPAEVAEAKAALKSAQAALKKQGRTAKGQDIQAPRAQAGAKQEIQAPRAQAGARQDVQAPRGQDVQAPRGQDVQAPRGQDVQAPRGQDVQAPRGQDVQAPRSQDKGQVDKAAALVRKAEAACKKKDMALAIQNAKEAIAVLR